MYKIKFPIFFGNFKVIKMDPRFKTSKENKLIKDYYLSYLKIILMGRY
jgi:hypothetical protein